MYYYRNVTDIVVIVIFKTLHFWKLYIKKLYRSKIRPTVTGRSIVPVSRSGYAAAVREKKS